MDKTFEETKYKLLKKGIKYNIRGGRGVQFYSVLALTIFICGFLIARLVNVFTNHATSVKRDLVVTFFQGLGLAGVIMAYDKLSNLF